MTNSTTPLRIDIDNVLRERIPNYYKFIPRFIIRALEHIICQDDLNQLLTHNTEKVGVDFCKGVVTDLGVKFKTNGVLPKDESRVIIVSNHPLGGLDGMILAMMASEQYGGRKDIKFVVNDLLNFIEPLRSIFLGVNKHGKQSREATLKLDQAFGSDAPILMFPAGLVSRKDKNGKIADLKWNKMVVNKAISSHRNIIPICFEGENSSFFYKFAQLRTTLGLKFNIEMIRLPREVFESAGKTFTIHIGSPISWKNLKGGKDAELEAAMLRDEVYRLSAK